jgi:hypothetical protein
MNLQIDQDVIDLYEADGVDFFERVLKMDYSTVLTTDISELSDFSFTGMPEGSLDMTKPPSELYASWDAYIKEAVEREYGLTLTSTRITLIELFERLRALKQPPTVH